MSQDIQHWVSLVVLMIGIALTQIAGGGDSKNGEDEDEGSRSKIDGVLAVFVACLCSGIIILCILLYSASFCRLCRSVSGKTLKKKQPNLHHNKVNLKILKLKTLKVGW